MSYRWYATNLEGSLRFMAGQTLVPGAEPPEWPLDCDSLGADTAVFADGRIVVVESRFLGPYSPVTPDVDAKPPRFWCGEPQ